jgi:hypothetical protein
MCCMCCNAMVVLCADRESLHNLDVASAAAAASLGRLIEMLG